MMPFLLYMMPFHPWLIIRVSQFCFKQAEGVWLNQDRIPVGMGAYWMGQEPCSKEGRAVDRPP